MLNFSIEFYVQFDPNSRRVLTLIGTGRLGTDKIGGLKRTQQPIASPWDLCITESPCKLYSLLYFEN